MAAGGGHSLLLKQDGSVLQLLKEAATAWCLWKMEVFGALMRMSMDGHLADESMNLKRIFVQVFCNGVKAIAAGSRHSMGMKQDNR